MSWFEALILGLIQGLTEFLPVSSSGHLELGKHFLGVNPENSLVFTVVVHGATVLSTIVVFRADILEIIRGMFKLEWNASWKFILTLVISMIPVLIVGLFFADYVESFFTGNIRFVGMMLLVTALLLFLSHFKQSREREITYLDGLVIGIAQMLAVLPGISRSGATISTGLLLGNKRELVARFSFLMVLVPILGANLLDLMSGEMNQEGGIGALPLAIGFLAAFISGLLACKWMIGIVKKGKLLYFAIYCLIIGSVAILLG